MNIFKYYKETWKAAFLSIIWMCQISLTSSSITVEYSTLPIDLTKLWLQIQGQKNDANYKEIGYCGMLHVLVTIGREEYLKVLYSG